MLLSTPIRTKTKAFNIPIILFASLLSLLLSCSARQQNLTIQLAETPLYPLKQWAVVKIPYIKISEKLNLDDSLLGMVRLGDIVEVERVEPNLKDQTMWAFIVSQTPQKKTAQGKQAKEQTLQGWVPYNFLHIVGNYVEGKLVSRQMSKPNQIFLNPSNENSSNESPENN